MGKKGKGKKGKEPEDGNVPKQQPGPSQGAGRGRRAQRPEQQQPGPSQETGRGRERPDPVQSPEAQSPEKDFATADPRMGGLELPSRTAEQPEGIVEARLPKGRGRGRGAPPQSARTPVPGIQQIASPREKQHHEIPAEESPSPQAKDPDLLAKMTGLTLKHDESVKPSLTKKKFEFAKRPSHARIDDRNRICLLVNYFKLEYKEDVSVYHYDINIYESTKEKKQGKSLLAEGRTAKEDIKQKVKHVEREKRRNLGKDRCRQIVAKLFKDTEALKKYCPVYDAQKNLFTSVPLPTKTGTTFPVTIKFEDKDKDQIFFVAIEPVEKKSGGGNRISLEPLINVYKKKSSEIPTEVLLVYETVMSHREPPIEQVHFRNSFFNLRDRGTPLGCGLEIWFGYHQSIQLTEVGPVTVINLAAKAFYKKGNVIDTANDVLERDITKIPRLEHWQIKNLTDTLKGLMVYVTHQPFKRKYKIRSIVSESAKDMKQDIGGKKMSIADYIFSKYRKKLAYPHLPLLQMHTNTNTTFMPMELCEIVEGQPKIGKLSGDLTARMIKSTAVPPQRRKEDILNHAQRANEISRRYMGAFGLLMDLKMMNVDGRIIAAPQLAYANNSTVKPDNKGVWRMDDGKKFYNIIKIEKWVVVSFADERRLGNDIISKYCQFLLKSARKCGMQIDPPCPPLICGRNVTTEQAMQKIKQLGAEFAIFVLNRRDNYHSYDEVKFLADFKYNIVTQCMEDKTLFRINDQITTNVCLKINVKLGGINHILYQRPTAFSSPVTVLGIDAIHWARGYGYPSILSVVGSLNPTASRYALICDLQKNEKREKISQEIIRDMKSIAIQILEEFRKANGIYPHKIIVFRDGVSEGQFQHALEYEVSGIQEACTELFQKILPVTFVVVQKRHQTRFFPKNPSQGVGRNLNVPPGTCVDQKITHPVFFDYFICSHEGIQGTSKPAKYTVLHDDNKFEAAELQSLCYFLCHTYVRCTRSVSLPAPVMYADLACARAKKYADLFISPENMSVGSEDSHKDLPPNVERAIRSMKSFKNNMFYV